MMGSALVYALCGAALVGIGLYGAITQPHLMRRMLALNVAGSGLFLVFGGLGARHAASGADPVPQALVITGIVVALAATALALTLITRLHEETGSDTLPEGAGDPSESNTRDG